jgi:hypothetical protein
MLTRDQQTTLWTNAYNAALTGLLASKLHNAERFTENNVQSITQQGKAFANQALKDALEPYQASDSHAAHGEDRKPVTD